MNCLLNLKFAKKVFEERYPKKRDSYGISFGIDACFHISDNILKIQTMHPVLFQVVSYCINLSLCLLSSCFVSSALLLCLLSKLSANSDGKAVLPFRQHQPLSSRGGKVVFTPLSLFFVSPKRGFPCPCLPSQSFLSFFLLKSCLPPQFACCQVHRNAFNPTCEGH